MDGCLQSDSEPLGDHHEAMNEPRASLRPRRRPSRRAFLQSGAGALASAAMASLSGSAAASSRPGTGALPDLPNFRPRARRAIWLFQSGGPSQIDLFDHKPALRDRHGEELPDSVRKEQRLTLMTSLQGELPVSASRYAFARHGEGQAWVSELMPHTAQIVDRLCFLKGVHTEAINHDPAITHITTGFQQPGRASMGAWLSWGLGSENQNLPAFMVLLSQGSGKKPGQPIFSRLWGSGFLPSNHQGVKLRGGASPVLYLDNPPGVDPASRRALLDARAELEALEFERSGDPEVEARLAQYEMAWRMQTSMPELVDLSDEPESTFELYGPDSRVPGTYARNCLLARRMTERGVRFVQLFHRGWDQHLNLDRELRAQCRDTDQASAALVYDLDRRGLLDDTLVVWGGEFGRTVYSQGVLDAPASGRDHHGRCFTVWLAGGGVRAPFEYGVTDDYGYNVVEGGVEVRDLNATILALLGIDHERFTFRHQGLDMRLTGVEESRVVSEILGPA